MQNSLGKIAAQLTSDISESLSRCGLMFRNKFHLKFKSEALSERLNSYLNEHRQLAEAILNADRLIVVYTLLTHKADFLLTYDNLLFLVNRIEMMDFDLMAMEPEDTKQMLNTFFNS